MSKLFPHPFAPTPRHFSCGLGWGICVLALMIWVGRVIDLPFLRVISPRGENLLTVFCFLLSGISLVLLNPPRCWLYSRQILKGCAGSLILLACLSLVESTATVFAVLGGRMSEASAFNFLWLGCAFLTIDGWRWQGWRPAYLCALWVSLMGLLAFTTYVYGVRFLYVRSFFYSMSLLPSLGFMMLGLGILCARKGEDYVQLFTRESRGGRLARRLLPLALLVPIAVGWMLLLLFETAGFFEFEFGLALLAMSNVILFSIVIWLTAAWVDRTDLDVKEQHLRHQQLIESLPQLVWTCRADGQCDYLSPQWVGYTGVPEGAQLGDGWMERIHPQDRARMLKRWEEACRHGRPLDEEFRIQRADGVYRWFQSRAVAQKNAQGEIIKWFGTHTDIDDRWQAETQAKASFKAIEDFKNALDEHALVTTTDVEGRIISVNDKLCELSEYSREEFLGRNHNILNSGHHSKEFFGEMWGTILSGKAWRGEVKNRKKRGGHFWVDTTIVPLFDEEGRPREFIAIRADITKLKHAQESIHRAHDEMEQQVELRTHELELSNAKLIKNAEQLSEAQRIALLGSWELDVETGEIQWSDELFHIIGLDSEKGAPAYSSLEKWFTAESWRRLEIGIAQAISKGEGYTLELEVVKVDGAHRWAVTRAEAFRDDQGNVVRLAGTFQDITELKEIRLNLERLTERFKLASEAAVIGVWDWDLQRDTLNWDQTMRDLFGIEGSISYERGMSMVHPEDLRETKEAMDKALAGEKDFKHVFRILRPDATVRYLYGAAVIHRDEEGIPLRMVGVNLDVTSEQEYASKLRASEKLLRDFVLHAPAAIAMMDQNMCYLQTSERWIIDYNLTGRDLIGRSHYEVFPQLPDHWKEVHRRVLQGAVEFCDEDPMIQPDGRIEWIQWEARPWYLSDGSIGGLLFFTQFITDRKEMELQLTQQKELLENSNRDLEQFAYVASHDLQEPLRAVTGCVQIFQRRYADHLDEDAEQLITHIVDGVDRMQNLIRDLLAYSRVGTRGKTFAMVESQDCLKAALENLQLSIDESGATVRVERLPCVKADPVQLIQLFQNLVGNAIKYQGDDPLEIHIDAQQEDKGNWRFSVSDNGIGMEKQYFDRIFMLFQRLHTRNEYTGTGIGLALCKKIIARHGGRIWVVSDLGKGSTFYFTIPLEN
ncbi:PAS domain-containing protein [Kiritimatiellota bacterium B12222]|nr:PAS domain-containing protein [Kiritimatiellota bacterium B12222]